MVEQGSPEWHAQRCGKVTASRIADLLARTKTGWGASRTNYAAQLVAERLTGCVAEGFSNAAMEWGVATEAEARGAYEFYTDCIVQPVGFINHPTINMSGASPDGFVGTEGLLEIKCPNTATHIDTLLSQSIPVRYQAQMTWQIACARRKWCDFVSYDPRMPEEMRLFVSRFTCRDDQIETMSTKVVEFLEEIDAKVSQLEKLYRLPMAAE